MRGDATLAKIAHAIPNGKLAPKPQKAVLGLFPPLPFSDRYEGVLIPQRKFPIEGGDSERLQNPGQPWHRLKEGLFESL